LYGGALIGVTAVWGITFPVVKQAVEKLPPYTFNGVRFFLAAVVLGAFALPRLRRLGMVGWRHGGLLGVMLFAGYAFQTVGLQYTNASNAGFVTGMFVVFTPLLSAVLLRRPPGGAAIVGVLCATVGLALLSLGPGFVPRSGDVIILGCAVAFAAHIVGLGAWSHRHDAVALTVVQLLASAVLHSGFALTLEVGRTPMTWDASVVVALLVTAVLASAAAFWIQTAAQRVIPPTRTAVILTMEPVFAGLFGFLLLDERLTARGWLGCALILAGMLIAELRAGAPPPAPPEDQTATAPGTGALAPT
jgi:drug/metabolite transporter (DMT)-like permease